MHVCSRETHQDFRRDSRSFQGITHILLKGLTPLAVVPAEGADRG